MVYKVDVDDIEAKLNLIQKAKSHLFLPLTLLLNGLFVFFYAWHISNDIFLLIVFSFFLIQSFVLYYYILPLAGKLELIVRDVERLKQESKFEDEVYY